MDGILPLVGCQWINLHVNVDAEASRCGFVDLAASPRHPVARGSLQRSHIIWCLSKPTYRGIHVNHDVFATVNLPLCGPWRCCARAELWAIHNGRQDHGVRTPVVIDTCWCANEFAVGGAATTQVVRPFFCVLTWEFRVALGLLGNLGHINHFQCTS